MFRVKANTSIQVPVPPSVKWYRWGSWMPHTTKEDRFYDKHEVFDAVALQNGREMPLWIAHNIRQGYVVLERDGKYAMLRPNQIKFLD